VRYVNDSKGTNVAAALRALASFPDARLHVILGGLGKNEPYEPLAAAFKAGDTGYVIGASGEEIARALEAAGVPVTRAGTLAAALAASAAAAGSSDVVLLSPACASFDQFRDFEARGDAFRALVQELG
jgi:UDP-N-acetylmuramoylalanine--D-glutamate ligase